MTSRKKCARKNRSAADTKVDQSDLLQRAVHWIPKWHAEAQQISAIMKRQPDLTLSELQAKLATSLARSTLCVALKCLKLTFKKKS